MASAQYIPGSWVAVGAESGWLLADIDPSDPMVLQCWSLIRRGAEIDEILDAVLQRGLRAVSSFALVRLSGDGRRAVVVRGAARADVTTDGGTESVSAEGVSTWREMELPARTAAVRVSAGEPAAADGEAPLSPGVTLASSLRVSIGELSAGRSTVVPEAPAPPPAPPTLVGPPSQLPPAPPAPPQPDPMAWLSAVTPLGTATDEAQPIHLNQPAIPPPPPAQPLPPTNGQAWAPPPSRPPDADPADSTVTRSALGLADEAAAGSMVQAVRCQQGHLSPPMAVSCRVCGFPLMGQAPISVPRPTLGVLRLSTGDVVPLDRAVIMGRNPRIDDAGEAARPHVVRLPSPGHDISRTHVEIRLDGWHVLLTDLNSVNGTVVTPPWQEPQRLRPNESVPIEPGTVVSLADEVTFRYEVTG